jgi:hypothetical protein
MTAPACRSSPHRAAHHIRQTPALDTETYASPSATNVNLAAAAAWLATGHQKRRKPPDQAASGHALERT